MQIQAGTRPCALQFGPRRILLILALAGMLTLILVFRAAWLASRRHHPESLQLEEFLIPGLRGSMLSRDGELLAWSERRLRLVWQLPLSQAEAVISRERLARHPELRRLLPEEDELPDHLGRKLVLCDAIDGSLVPELLALVDVEDLSLQGYFVRHVSGVVEVIGRVAVDPVSGLELGVTGLEKKYDHRLRGGVLRYTRVFGSSKLTRLYASFFSDSGNGEDVVVACPPKE